MTTYYSTSQRSPEVNLQHAVMAGFAPDGGLYMPSRLPLIPKAFFNNIALMSPSEIAYVVADTLFGDSVDSRELARLAAEAVDFPLPHVDITPDISALEMWHGPTGSFNDVGARFLAGLLRHFPLDLSRPVNFIMATSGDSGAAVARALHGLDGVKATILYPAHAVSDRQRALLTSPGDNITAVEVNGDIAKCRSLVSEALTDRHLVEKARLTPANSTNIARFLPQITLYFVAYARKRAAGDNRALVLALPGGNLGNLAAGLTAMRMGLPVSRFVLATDFSGVPSNLPRILALYDGDISAVGRVVSAHDHAAIKHSSLVYATDADSRAALDALALQLNPDNETGTLMAVSTPGEAGITAGSSGMPVKIGRSLDALKKLLLTH